MSTSPSQPVVLFDGHCALCHAWVRFLLWADVRGALRFAPLTGDTAQHVLRAHDELAGIDSLILLRDDRVTVRSTAILGALDCMGGAWAWLSAGLSLTPRRGRDWLYDIVARWRYRVLGRHDVCPLPPPASRSRFLP